jgi:hypothetical protein
MGYSRLNHDYFRASNILSYVVPETFFALLLVNLSSHLAQEFFDL